ncbi:MAG: hypothetical protein ACOCP4_06915 [Candidatus Woesearchaeota archaeon]
MDIEKMLYNYIHLKYYIDNYENEKADNTAGINGISQMGEVGISSVVEDVVLQLLVNDYEKESIEKFVNVVTEVLQSSDTLLKFYNYNYFRDNVREDVQEKMGISRRTYYRYRSRLINEINQKLKNN